MDDYNYNENDDTIKNSTGEDGNPKPQWQPVYQQPVYQQPAPAPKNGFGTAALIFGILAVFGSMTVWFGIIFGVAAIVCAAISRINLGKFDAKSAAGLVLGIVFLVISLLLFFMALAIIQNPEIMEQINDIMQQGTI